MNFSIFGKLVVFPIVFHHFQLLSEVFQFQPEVPGSNLIINSTFKYLAYSSLISEQPCEMEY